MTKQFTGTTFSDTYRDDFSDSAGYHKVLFNSGRALQGRELNQLQTILQTQITRMANNLFFDGAAVSPKSSGAGCDITDYVVVEELFKDADEYVGTLFQGPAITGSNGLQFQVSYVTEASGADYPTLYGRYISANQSGVSTDEQTQLLTFDEGQTLTNASGEGLAALSVRTQPAASTIESAGKGVLFSIQQAEFYIQGHFVYAPKQTLPIQKYSSYVDAEVGFEVIQDIVTTSDDEGLYDNQGTRPNLSAPGADRYRIRMVLTTRTSIAEEEDFCTFATVRASKIVQIKNGTDNYNQIEKRLAIRQSETTGNFIEKDFELQIIEGEDSANLIVEIPAETLGGRPVAYLDGYRLEHQVGVSFNAEKPVSFVSDSDLSINAGYKNYISFEADSAGGSRMGGINSMITSGANGSIGAQQRIRLLNISGDTIGFARQKGYVNRDTGDSDNYRLHLYDINMKGSNNFRDVRELSGPTHYTGDGIVPVLEDGGLYLTQPENSTSLFSIPDGRVKHIDVTGITVQRSDESTVDASSQVTITCSADEQFADEGQWIFINKTTDTVDELGSGDISVVGTTATITTNGVASTDVYVVLYYVQKNSPAPRSKTYREAWFDATKTTDSSGTNFLFSDLYDGVELLEAYNGDSTGSVLLHALEFDGGQRDNYYGPVKLRPDGVPTNVSTVRAKVGYFEWGSNADFFSVNSYDLEDSTWFGYSEIPTYVSKQNGREYPLHDYLDFRSKLDPLADNMSATTDHFELPRDGDQIQYGVQHYNNRIDHVTVTYDEEYKAKIQINKGVEAKEPVPPNEKKNQMVLFDIAYNGNTKNNNDLQWNRRRYRAYKMTDIHRLEDRVGRLEETVSLSALEQEASSLVELTSEGAVRSKTGFFVDDFSKGMALTASTFSTDFIDDASFATSSVDEETFTMHCKFDVENVGFNYDSANLFASRGVTKSNVVRKGDNIMLDYREVLDPSLKQEVISWKGGDAYEEHGYYNVNPFNVFLGEGTLRLNPSRDVWFDNRRIPDRQINGGTFVQKVGEPIIPRTFTFSRTSVRRVWVAGRTNGWFRTPTGISTTTSRTTFTVRQSVRTEVVGQQDFTRTLDDRTVAILSVPFMRQRRVLAKAEGLRPNTRYWCFMDGIRMDQWVHSRTESEYVNLIRGGAHRKEYPSSNVSLTKSPFYSGDTYQQLLTDANGELYYDLWIPNNARIPVPLSNTFNSVNEWQSWIEAQRRYARQYGSSKSVNAMNKMGWKFRCGSKVVKLLDISVDSEEDALSRARSVFSSWGRVDIKQRTVETTRVITVQDRLSSTTTSSTSSNTTFAATWRDPLAQTFTIDGGSGVPGVFVTRVDVFIRNCPSVSDTQVPLQLQIRGVNAGVPQRDAISEQHRVYKSAASVRSDINAMVDDNLTSVLGHPVSMEFAEPVFLRTGEEYAIVLLAECDKYEAYVASTYDLLLGSTSKRVNKQPSKGSLFLSQNGSTWTPKQNQDMAYRIYTAKFKSQGAANFYNSELSRHRHNFSTSLSVDSDNLDRLRVNHQGHGLGIGDVVRLTGLDSSASYNGVSSLVIMDSTNTVNEADVNGYFVTLSSPFTSTGPFGADSVQTNKGFNIDRATLNFNDLVFDRTEINYQGSFASGVSHADISLTGTSDPRFDIDENATLISNRQEHFFNTPKYLANPDQEYSELSPLSDSAPSVLVGATLTTDQTSTFGGDLAATVASSDYVSDVSPVIDTQALGMVFLNNVIDNQAIDSASASDANNVPSDFVPESHPTLGTSPSKHITRIVQLNQAASGVKVLLDMYKPPAADFDVYYRTGADADVDLYENEWVLATSQNSPPDAVYSLSDDNLTFQEYRYLIGGTEGDLPEFVSFQIKVVMRSSNTCQPPVLNNVRAIALI